MIVRVKKLSAQLCALLLLSCWCLSPVMGQDASSWMKFSPAGEAFTVSIPGTPAASRRAYHVGRIDAAGMLYSVSSGGVDYRVWSLQDRARLSQPIVTEEMYLDACADLVWESLLKPERERAGEEKAKKSYMGYIRELQTGSDAPGRAYSIDIDTTRGIVHFYAAVDRIYVVMTLAPVTSTQTLAPFLNSFTLTKRGAQTIDTDPILSPPGQPSADPKTAGVGSGIGTGAAGSTGAGNTGVEEDNRIFSPREATQKARVLAKPEPQYTEAARKYRVSGTVVLRGVFSSKGALTNIKVVSRLPHGLTEQAIAAAEGIRFTPAMKDGRAVSQYIQIEYNFNLYDDEGSQVESQANRPPGFQRPPPPPPAPTPAIVDAWAVREAPQDQFSVEAPSELRVKEETATVIGATLHTNRYTALGQEGDTFVVSATATDGGLAFSAEKAAAGIISSIKASGAKILSEQSYTYAGCPAHEAMVEARNNEQLIFRAVASLKRGFVLMYVARRGRALDTARAQRFLNSFKFDTTACSESIAAPGAKPDLGTSAGGVYTNKYFGLHMKLPPGWPVQDNYVRGSMIEAGRRVFQDKGEAVTSVVDNSLSKTTNLLTVFKRSLGAEQGFNASLIFGVEEISGMVLDSQSYAVLNKKMLQLAGLPYKYSREAYSEKLGGVEFSVIEISMERGERPIKQRYYTGVRKGYALFFILTYVDEADLPVLEQSLRSITFQ